MCWRGHDADRAGGYHCLDCHAIRMRAYRQGRRPRRRTLYRLDRAEFRRRARGRVQVIAELAGVPLPTLACWLYRGVGTTRDRAQAVADAMRVEFGSIWRPDPSATTKP